MGLPRHYFSLTYIWISLFGARWLETGRNRSKISLTEQEADHVFFNYLDTVLVGGVKPVLIYDHGEAFHPLFQPSADTFS